MTNPKLSMPRTFSKPSIKSSRDLPPMQKPERLTSLEKQAAGSTKSARRTENTFKPKSSSRSHKRVEEKNGSRKSQRGSHACASKDPKAYVAASEINFENIMIGFEEEVKPG